MNIIDIKWAHTRMHTYRHLWTEAIIRKQESTDLQLNLKTMGRLASRKVNNLYLYLKKYRQIFTTVSHCLQIKSMALLWPYYAVIIHTHTYLHIWSFAQKVRCLQHTYILRAMHVQHAKFCYFTWVHVHSKCATTGHKMWHNPHNTMLTLHSHVTCK